MPLAARFVLKALDRLSVGRLTMRLPDGSTNIVAFPDSASPEEANWLPLLNSVVINEALTRPGAPRPDAAVKFNGSGGEFMSMCVKGALLLLVTFGFYRFWLTTDEVSTVIDAPAELVYDLVADMPRMGEWSRECSTVEWIEGATGPAVGARFVDAGLGARGLGRLGARERFVG